MPDYYLPAIQLKKKGNMDIYHQVLLTLFGKTMTWKEVQQQDKETLRTLLIELERNITLNTSPLDVTKLARAIQSSRSGIGGNAITPFTCKLCGNEETWTNTAVPHICHPCAKQMATKIILQKIDIFKSSPKNS